MITVIDRFLALGMSDDDAVSRAALLDRTTAAFTGWSGGQPAWRWFVPGRIEVFGKHTDYAGGRSLLAAVPRGFALAARRRDDGIVRVLDGQDGAHGEVDLGRERGAVIGWGMYVDVVARRLARNFPGARLGADLAFISDLPRAAGLSSSSALVVGVATALVRCAGLTERPEWHREIGSLEDLAWYLGCVENGLDYRGLSAAAGVGTHGGSEDHTAILNCHAGQLSQYRYVPVQHVDDTPLPDAWTFVVAASGVRADKAGAQKDAYNSASLAARALLECWNATADVPAVSLGAALAGPDDVDRLIELVDHAPAGGFSAEALGRRLAFFVAEDARVPAAVRAFRTVDGAALGALADASQHEADKWLENQVPETRALAALAREHGALAACSFGAGFGGSVWAAVLTADATRFARE
jgi:galactokinase